MRGENLSGLLVGVVFLAAFAVIAFILVRRYWVLSLKDDERGVLFRFGRYAGLRGPGVILVLPLIDRLVIVPLSTQRIDVPALHVVTRDRQSVTLYPFISIRVRDPEKAILKIVDYRESILRISTDFLQREVGAMLSEEMKSALHGSALQLRKLLELQMRPVGILVENMEIQVRQSRESQHTG
jgi:regulator of protease activity HflC (stomatin/prohibitin superfamily)